MNLTSEIIEVGLKIALGEDSETPFYMLDLEGIKRSACAYRTAWLEHFPEARFSWSYKTNPVCEVTSCMRRIGYDAEVVTMSEWHWAIEDGLTPSRIIVNGPVKSDELIEASITSGAIFHVDNLEELDRILLMGISDATRIGLRLSHPLDEQTTSRFGMTGDEVTDAISRLNHEGIEVSTLHMHTPHNASISGRLAGVCKYQDLIRECLQGNPSLTLNLGGGDSAPRFGEDVTESLSDDIAQLARLVEAIGINPTTLPLRLEPGRALVEQHGIMIARVTGCKKRGQKNIVHCDARSELLRSRGKWVRPATIVTTREDGTTAAKKSCMVEVYGSHCYETDFLTTFKSEGRKISTGDPIIFGCAGGYDLSSSGIWGGPRPEVFLLSDGNLTKAEWRSFTDCNHKKKGDWVSQKDELFNAPHPRELQFHFSEDVANVFDDMISRSVPVYDEVQQLIARLALRWANERPIIDLGCSTGTTLYRIAAFAPTQHTLFGIDSSEPMLEKAMKKLSLFNEKHNIHFACSDIHSVDLGNYGKPGVIILSLVMQFMRPLDRQNILNKIHDALHPGGVLLILEKTLDPDPEIAAAFIDEYHIKKTTQGYSQKEIRQKREALENRLIPFHPEENLNLLRSAGFKRMSIFYNWLNFQGYLAIKDE